MLPVDHSSHYGCTSFGLGRHHSLLVRSASARRNIGMALRHERLPLRPGRLVQILGVQTVEHLHLARLGRQTHLPAALVRLLLLAIVVGIDIDVW